MIAGAGSLAALAMGAAVVTAQLPRVEDTANASLREARSDYVEHCGGCHGVNGSSAPARVPELRGRIGYFLCTREGRDYLVRLPNVAHAPLPDPAALARLLNYVVFDLGQGSAPAGAAPYRAEEIDRLRRHPIVRSSLVKERGRLVADMRRRCSGVPASMAGYSSARPNIGPANH